MGVDVRALLGKEADSLLHHESKTIPRDQLVLPGPDFIDRVFVDSDRPIPVVRNRSRPCTVTGGWVEPGYLSILPVDQGIERSTATSFSKNPSYFDPGANLIELALAAGSSGIATTLGGLGIVARRYAHRIPFIVKLNHNEFLHYPNKYDQVMFAFRGSSSGGPRRAGRRGNDLLRLGGVRPAARRGSRRRSSRPTTSASSPCSGATCATRPSRPPMGGLSRGRRPDGTGQPHRGDDRGRSDKAEAAREQWRVTRRCRFGRTDPLVYDQLTTDNPIDMTRWQVLENCYAGRVGLINSGGESKGSGGSSPSGANRRDQQACRRDGPDSGAKSLPAADGGRCGAPAPRPFRTDVFLDRSIQIA